MESITFHCKVITPMFLAGADGQTPELRAPSIKGAMRFWWRALNGHLPLHELKKKEDEIFGGTDRRSRVILTAHYADENMNDDNVPKFNYIRDYKALDKGVKYLNILFFEYEDVKKREAIAPGVEFNVTIMSKNKEKLIEAANVFWVMSLLGGLGTRSRRGDGSFKINKSSRKGITRDELPFYHERKGVQKLGHIQFLQKLLTLPESDETTSYSSLKWADIFFSKGSDGFSTWHDAVSDIANKMMQIRDNDTRTNIDRSAVKFTMDDMPKKAAFGLPINIRPPLQGTVNLYNQSDRTDSSLEASRRASPIVVSINRIGKNYYWTIAFLQGIFMPSSSRIKYERNGSGNSKWEWEEEDQLLVNQFRNKLMDDWGKKTEEDLEAELDAIKYGTPVTKKPRIIKYIKL